MKHIFYEDKDLDKPDQILDRNGEVVLALCKKCGCCEGAMTTDCPEQQLSTDDLDYIYQKRIDFKNNEWVLV